MNSPAFSLDVVDQVQRLYPEAAEMDRLLDRDRDQFMSALAAIDASKRQASGRYQPVVASGKKRQPGTGGVSVRPL